MPARAAHILPILAERDGVVTSIDNRNLARIAKLAGAPKSTVSGIRLLTRLGDKVEAGQPLFELHAAVPGELAYAGSYLKTIGSIIEIDPLQAG